MHCYRQDFFKKTNAVLPLCKGACWAKQRHKQSDELREEMGVQVTVVKHAFAIRGFIWVS
jgi:hypothetical protein